VTNWYASLADLKSRVGIADTLDDAVLKSVLESISREIDQWTGRRFYVETRTRTYRARQSGCLVVDDLLSVTSLKTDVSGDRDYTDVWAVTDYDLRPDNAPYESPPQPYWQLCRAPGGDFTFPTWLDRGVQIVGKWGYYEVLETSTATLAEDLDTSETAVDVSSGAVLEVGQTILIDSEQFFITNISTNTLTVDPRGTVNGTSAATHSNGATIRVYTYPIVNEAAILQANHLFTSSRIAGGVLGGEGFGAVRIPALNPLVMSMLNPFRKITVA
jgi:hypothetical protein